MLKSDERKSILLKPMLSAHDIAKLEEISLQTAYRHMQSVKKYYGGVVPMNKRFVKTSAYFKFMGYTEEEMKDYLEVLSNGDKQV